MNFDKFTYPCNHHHNQDIGHFHHLSISEILFPLNYVGTFFRSQLTINVDQFLDMFLCSIDMYAHCSTNGTLS